MPTRETALTGGIPFVNLDQVSTVPVGFVVELGDKLRPPHIADRFAECRVLDHVLHLQALHADRLVFTDQAGGELVQKITAAISDTSMKARHLETRLVSIFRPFFLPGMAALGFRQLFLILVKESGVAYHFARRENHKGRQAKVSTNGLLIGRQMRNLFFHQDADEVPSSAVFGDGDTRRSYPIRQRARPANIERLTHLGKRKRAIAPGEGISSIGSGLCVSFFVEGGVRGTAFKEIEKRFVQVTKSLLQGHAGNLIEPVGLFLLFQLSQQEAQIFVIEASLLVVKGSVFLRKAQL